MGSITPLLRIPSVRAVSLALAAPRQLATLLFFVANKPPAVCAYLVLGAAVPWHLYRLKCDKRNLDWQIICCFVVPFLGFSLLRAEERNMKVRCSMLAFQLATNSYSLVLFHRKCDLGRSRRAFSRPFGSPLFLLKIVIAFSSNS
jgi:hypothetical protein